MNSNEILLISGGIPRKFGELMSAGHVLKTAELAELDFITGEYVKKLTYTTPNDFCPDNKPSIAFTCYSFSEDEILIATHTEVLILERDTYKIKQIITDPLFNDLHDVKKYKDMIYVAVTGMDAVFVFNEKGERLKIFNVIDKDPFHRFSKSSNLNKIASTKPHESHPNHIFFIDGDVWVTRFIQKDAICLTNPSKRMNINIGSPHDGFVKDDLVYFTTTNGYVVVFNKKTLEKVKEIKLTGSNERTNSPLGWCRGLFLDDQFFYVGFTQLRTTKFTENLAWVSKMMKQKKIVSRPAPSRIEKYTIDGQFVSECLLPSEGIFTVFTINKI